MQSIVASFPRSMITFLATSRRVAQDAKSAGRSIPDYTVDDVQSMLQNLGLAQYGPMFLSKKVRSMASLNSSYRKLAILAGTSIIFNSYYQFAYCAPDLISLKAHPI